MSYSSEHVQSLPITVHLEKTDNLLEKLFKQLASFFNTPKPQNFIIAPELSKRVIVNYSNWNIYQRGYTPDMMPLEKITHVLYAFAKLNMDGTVQVSDPWADIDKPFPDGSKGCIQQLNHTLKKKYPHLKTLISIGGWLYSGYFSKIARDSVLLETFSDSAINFVRKHVILHF